MMPPSSLKNDQMCLTQCGLMVSYVWLSTGPYGEMVVEILGLLENIFAFQSSRG